MPLFLQKELQPQGKIGIWKITESEAYFQSKLELYPSEIDQLILLKGRRRLEWLASRYLLHLMSERETRGAVVKDEFGKPHLEHSAWHISMSHSHEMAAVIAAPILVGIDIQYLVPKIEVLASKFMRTEELASLHPESRMAHLHVYWGAKECLYKIYGRRELDFRSHILIHPFQLDFEKGLCTGDIVKEDIQLSCQIHYEPFGEFMLVWANAR